MIGGAAWGCCRGCAQWRPLRKDGTVKIHPVVAGLAMTTATPASEADR